ncbi:hypothetical protein [Pseudonocardia cypriaca]|uniref:WD40 repeat protein n=1 Tax=Pseudonocardia cypriaca TaxID=882449 RepID=A0A543GCV3_9PSEU|nr:hypothetical protein [Pseudonocardia cypriaca]TQM43913.1 hypothetical protein FB388_1270 [Pseudonocardia cypriaca]
MACTVVDGRPIAVTAGRDAAVRMWALREGRELERIDLPGEVHAIDVGVGNVIVAGFGSEVVVLEPTGGCG